MPLQWITVFGHLLSAAGAYPGLPWAAAILAMWKLHNELVDREWGIRLRRAGLNVPSAKADPRFRGLFTAPMVGTFLQCRVRHGTEQAARIVLKILSDCISEHPVDEAFLGWLLENPMDLDQESPLDTTGLTPVLTVE